MQLARRPKGPHARTQIMEDLRANSKVRRTAVPRPSLPSGRVSVREMPRTRVQQFTGRLTLAQDHDDATVRACHRQGPRSVQARDSPRIPMNRQRMVRCTRTTAGSEPPGSPCTKPGAHPVHMVS